MLRAQAGDRAALEALLDNAAAMLRPYATLMLRDADAADDAVQETLVLLYRKLSSLREPRAFDAWARRIASREIFRAIGRRRAHDRTHEPIFDDVPAATAPEAPSDALVERLRELLDQVSPASRAVLALHYLDGLSLTDVATILDVAPGTAKSRLAYGLTQLRRLLPEEPAP